VNGFESATTETLRLIHANLLRGLEAVSEEIDKGDFHTIGPKGEASPAQSGQLTLMLLTAIEAELEKR